MVQNGGQDVRRDTEPGHAARRCSSEVVKGPGVDGGQAVQPALHLGEAGNRTFDVIFDARLGSREDQRGAINPGQGVEDGDGLGGDGT